MKAYTYILFSEILDRYYFGSTQLNPEDRLKQHLAKSYGNAKFTAKTNDWKLRFVIECPTIDVARKIETYLKKMKNRKYLEWLFDNPEAIDNIKAKF